MLESKAFESADFWAKFDASDKNEFRGLFKFPGAGFWNKFKADDKVEFLTMLERTEIIQPSIYVLEETAESLFQENVQAYLNPLSDAPGLQLITINVRI